MPLEKFKVRSRNRKIVKEVKKELVADDKNKVIKKVKKIKKPIDLKNRPVLQKFDPETKRFIR